MKSLKTLSKLISFLLIFLFLDHFFSFSQIAPSDIFEGHNDIGKVQHPGSVSYNSLNQAYSLTGSGENIWFNKDAFFFNWSKLKRNFILRARISFVGMGTEPHRKAGWMIRKNLNPDAAHVSAVVHGDGLASLQYREDNGRPTMEIQSDISKPDVIQLERRGTLYIMSVARFGEPFQTVQVSKINLGEDVYAGLFICSHNNKVSEKAIFKNVRIVIPAVPDLVPYEEYLVSNMEILNIQKGLMKIVYQSPTSIQAPNWTPDGSYLIYNKQGLIYRFNIDKRESSKVNTGFAKSNNNDHVISFDVYKKSIFFGEPELRLTRAKGLDDGPEYSPDGKYIYFNSNRTGTMQIWRMKPDGSEQEQLSFDAYNDWFPHLSPNSLAS